MYRALLTKAIRPLQPRFTALPPAFRFNLSATHPFSSASFPSNLDHSQSPAAFISDKRYGKAHTGDEIMSFIDRYQRNEVKDYQMSAWLMAVCLKGMTPNETAALTKSMVMSGDIADLTDVPGISVDKHSTGGVGDKISLVLAPLVASFGLVVPMMSGRGLGHTGGTLDKLDSIPGFSCDLDMDNFKNILRTVGVAMISPAGDMAPVDKRIYALRDVTSTVRAIPLQTSSIMCKKLAENPESLVLDVKFGSGAFNHEVEESIELAKSMVEAGEGDNKPTTAFITSMDEPIGWAVGNWNEIHESIQVLSNDENPLSADLLNLVVVQCGQMLLQGGVASTLQEGITMAKENLKNGKALAKFHEMVEAQGGSLEAVKNPTNYPSAKHSIEVISTRSGYVTAIDALAIGLVGVDLGAGRKFVEDDVDFTAGIELRKKTGDKVEEGDVLAVLSTNRDGVGEVGKQKVEGAYKVDEEAPSPTKLITNVVRKGGVVEDFDESMLQ
ncbi:hypothetical protein TrLO_g12931 [Triparma laevis f. longispina]|uniref:Thymidine phosphorylase n=1 Tax=Triparma laevis f. longispina TaxID=1714387 RepID=A0A9W7KZ28_9STRA|nr:hypothetical protein TrLO_g12931 [Triparma laevis f. longispina]